MYFISERRWPEKKAKITAEGDFSQPSSKYHSFAEVFLVSLIWGERKDFEINKQRKGEKHDRMHTLNN